MNKQLVLRLITKAGILAIPALVYPGAYGQSASPEDLASTPAIQAIIASPWSMGLDYSDMPREEAWEKARGDVEFFAWMAEKAREEGIELGEEQRAAVEAERERQLRSRATRLLAQRIEPSEEDLRRAAEIRKWNTATPERHEISYLFIDDSDAQTTEEMEAIAGRALRIARETTPGNFDRMARLWSDLPSSAEGGRMGLVALDEMGPTFRKHARRVEPGTVGGPFRTKSGWNILHVRQVLPEKAPDYTEEDLRRAAKADLAVARVKAAWKNPEEWAALIEELDLKSDPTADAAAQAMENYLLSKKYMAQSAGDEKPGGEELRALYAEYGESLRTKPRWRVREIVLSSPDWSSEPTRAAWEKRKEVRDRARELRQRALEGEDFAELAREYSESPTGDEGGDLGWIAAPATPLLDRTLRGLEEGEISAPREVKGGYALFQLAEEEQPRQKTYEEARAELENLWVAQQRRAVLQNLREEFEQMDSSTQWIKIAEDLEFPEGPAWAPDGSLYVSSCQGGYIVRIKEGMSEVFLGASEQPAVHERTNGLTIGPGGDVFACEYGEGKGAILRLSPGGDASVYAPGYEGKPFNRPNDLAFDPKGNLYFTDPKSYDPDNPDGVVYRVDGETGEIMPARKGFCFPNGLAFTEDGKHLMLAESAKHRVLKMAVQPDGMLGEPEVFAEMPGGDPDGMNFDVDGNLFVAHFGGGAIWKIAPDGTALDKIETPGSKPSNVEFGGEDRKTLFITEDETNSVYHMRGEEAGLPLFPLQ